jgi:hypothetical protein
MLKLDDYENPLERDERIAKTKELHEKIIKKQINE